MFIKLAELHLQFAAQGDDAGLLLCMARVQFGFKVGGLRQLFLSDIDHDEQGFGGEELIAGEQLSIPGGKR